MARPWLAWLLLAAGAWLAPAGAAADPAPRHALHDAPAPSLGLDSDPEVPRWVLSVAVDPVGIALGRYGAAIEGAPARAHALWLTPGWQRQQGLRGFWLEAGYHLFPLGRGVHGPFAGPLGSVTLARGTGTVAAAEVGGEAGYQHVWGGLVLGLAAGATVRWHWTEGEQRTRTVLPRIRAVLGWAWM